MTAGILKYVGGGEFILGIPAKDLTPQEISTLESIMGYKDLAKFLVEKGLYEEIKPKATKAAGEVSRGSS